MLAKLIFFAMMVIVSIFEGVESYGKTRYSNCRTAECREVHHL